jgi:uncharacterized protein YceK
MRSKLTLAVALLVLAGCSSGGSDAAPKPSTSASKASTSTTVPQSATPTTTALEIPTDTPPPTQDRLVALQMPTGKLNAPIDIGKGMEVTVGTPKVDHDEVGPWLAFEVTAENGGEEPVAAPDVRFVCLGVLDGGNLLPGGTYQPGALVQPGETQKGTLKALTPGDGRFGDPSYCVAPAYLRIEPAGTQPGAAQRRIDLTKAQVDALNESIFEQECRLTPSSPSCPAA